MLEILTFRFFLIYNNKELEIILDFYQEVEWLKRIKKPIALLLTVLLLLSSAAVAIFAAGESAKSVDANVLMFESLLRDRPWVVDSLVKGDFSTNPFTSASPYASEESLMTSVLTNYQNDKAFQYLVDTMEEYDNASYYVKMELQEMIAVFSYWLGMMDDDELITYTDETIKSVDDLQYEGILNDILKEDYTSSWGSTLFEANSSVEEYRQWSDTLSKLSNYQKALRTNSDVLAAGYFEDFDAFSSYVDDFIGGFQDALYSAVTNSGSLKDVELNESLTKKMTTSFAMATVLALELESPRSREISGEADLMNDIYRECMAPDINAVLDGLGDVLKIAGDAAEYATKYASLLESLVDQNDTTVQVMNRMRSHTSDSDLSVTLGQYVKLVEEQSDAQALSYDLISDYLNSQSWLGDAAIKGAGKLFDKILTLRNGYFDADLQVMTNATSQNLIKIGKCIQIGVWLADKATSIKDTAKEIYVCKYTKKILNAAIATYKADYKAYCSDKSDANAKNCIDDLEYIKKIRLYGEKHAYKSMCYQTESVVGLLLGSAAIQSDMAKQYQGQIDSLLGCTVLPQSNISFTVGKGETLTLMPETLDNGYVTLTATYKKATGETIYFAEADSILMSCLTVSGGTVKLFSLGENSSVIFAPSIRVTADSVIEVSGSQVGVGTLVNSGALTLRLKTADSVFLVADSLNNTGTLNITGSGQPLECYIVNNSGTVNLENTSLTVTGSMTNSGTVNGTVRMTGNATNPYSSLSTAAAVEPALNGTGAITHLQFDTAYKKGVRIAGRQSVSGSVSSGNTRLRTSENIIMTGSCTADSDFLSHNITFRDYSSVSALTVGGTAYIENDVTFRYPVTFRDGLNLTSSCKTLTIGSATDVKGDMVYNAGTITGSDWLRLHGDLTVNASSPGIAKLDFVGTLPQRVSASSELTVTELNNHNTSLGGVTFGSRILVTGVLQSGSTSAYANGANVVLTGDAKLNGNTIRGSISAKDWTVSDDMTVGGTLYTSGAITVKEGKTLSVVCYRQSGGTLTLEKDALLAISGDAVFGGVVTNAGCIEVCDDSGVTAALTGGTLRVKGDLTASEALKPDTLIFESKTAQSFTNSVETVVKNLTVNNSSHTGLTVGSVLRVTDTYTNPGSTITGGKNLIVAIEGGDFILDAQGGDLTISGVYTVTADNPVTVKGDLYLKNGASVTVEPGATLTVERSLIATGSSVTVEEGGRLQVNDCLRSSSDTLTVAGELLIKGDAGFSSDTVTASGEIIMKGDCAVNGGIWNSPNLTFESKTAQRFTSGSEISVTNLTLRNSSRTGIEIAGNIRVLGTLTNESKRVSGGERILLSGVGYISDGETAGDFSADGPLTVETGETLTVNGTLNLKSGAVLTVKQDAVLTVKRNLVANGAQIKVEEGGSVLIEDFGSFSSCTLTVDGSLLMKGDARVSSCTVNAAGLITLKGDLSVSSGTWNDPNLAFISKLPQTVSGSSFRAGNLTVDNRCRTGIAFSTAVTCSGTVDTGDSAVTGSDNIKKSS